MEKLGEVSRMRLPDSLRQGIRQVMDLEDRRNFGETVCHLLRVAVDLKLERHSNGLVENVRERRCIGVAKPPSRVAEWDGVTERRKRA